MHNSAKQYHIFTKGGFPHLFHQTKFQEFVLLRDRYIMSLSGFMANCNNRSF